MRIDHSDCIGNQHDDQNAIDKLICIVSVCAIRLFYHYLHGLCLWNKDNCAENLPIKSNKQNDDNHLANDGCFLFQSYLTWLLLDWLIIGVEFYCTNSRDCFYKNLLDISGGMSSIDLHQIRRFLFSSARRVIEPDCICLAKSMSMLRYNSVQ